MAQEYNIAQQDVGTGTINNYCQPELITRGGMREGSVIEDAVERNSRGKSRCEQTCRFPNTGGLHRTSGDAPLETPTLWDPELITRGGMHEGSVVEDAVERSCTSVGGDNFFGADSLSQDILAGGENEDNMSFNGGDDNPRQDPAV